MMRLFLSLIWLVLVMSFVTCGWKAFAGLPPTTAQGQYDSSAMTKFNFQVPQHQATNLGGIQVLLETGNQNLLNNPSFENTTYDSGWTSDSGSTNTAETTIIVDGKKSAKLTYSASGSGGITQSVTPSVYTNGVPYEATCRVATTLAAIQVCSMVNGSEGSCSTVANTGDWVMKTITFTGPTNGQSVGVRVKNTSSATGSAYVDNCYVGPDRSIRESNTASVYGTLTYAGVASCDWTGTGTTTFQSYSADTDCNAPSVTGSASAPATKIPGVTFNSLAAGTYQVTFNFRVNSAGSPKCIYRMTDGTTNSPGINGDLSGPMSITYNFVYGSSQGSTTFQVQYLRSGGTSCRVDLSGASEDMYISVTRFQ